MDKKVLCSVMVMLVVSSLLVDGYVISSPLDDVDKCIYTCDYCFKERTVVKCANECLMTDGKMLPFWVKICPEFAMPLYFSQDLNVAENNINSHGLLDNKLH